MIARSFFDLLENSSVREQGTRHRRGLGLKSVRQDLYTCSEFGLLHKLTPRLSINAKWPQKDRLYRTTGFSVVSSCAKLGRVSEVGRVSLGRELKSFESGELGQQYENKSENYA